MAIFRCKMCGGTLEFQPGDTVGICESCGTKQTLPRLTDEKRVRLYERADRFRRNNDYDRAAAIYNKILEEDPEDAEAYWSLVLCRYGIEYVEDPLTHRRIPTMNRTQYISVFQDDDYRMALKYADENQKSVYEDEAAAINSIQKEYLAISSREKAYDVFICYKESDESGQTTVDSGLAFDLYNLLTKEGYRVFYAPVSLDDKIGMAYEPYIFAALNSAPVMIAIGTRKEYFEAVWVRNEWKRFLMQLRENHKKVLIPAYKGMDPHDIPVEFSHLQALNMAQPGFKRDLLMAVRKYTESDQKNDSRENPEVASSKNDNPLDPLVKRMSLFLNEGELEKADQYAERILDQDPECAEAYLVKFAIDVFYAEAKKEAFVDDYYSYQENNNYQWLIRFGNEELKAEADELVDELRNDAIYEHACAFMREATTAGQYGEAVKYFSRIPGVEDADSLKRVCEERQQTLFAKEKRTEKIGIFIGVLCVLVLFMFMFI